VVRVLNVYLIGFVIDHLKISVSGYDSTLNLNLSLALSSILVLFFNGWFIFGWMKYIFNMCRLDNHLAEGREFEPRANFFNEKNDASIHDSVNQST